MSNFDPAATFLLDLDWSNLYELADARPGALPVDRCKGCGELLQISGRAKHHRRHRKEMERENVRRQERIKRERVKVLATARVARRQAA